MNRREFLGLSAVTSIFLLAGCGGGSSSSSDLSNLDESSKKLPIPTLLSGVDRGGVKHYDLTINRTKHNFFDNVQTNTYAFNEQTFLGPTILLENGDDVSINYKNNLNEPTTVHGHGMHVPAVMDGAAHQPIAVGETWSAKYRVNQEACTNWYHPHYMGKTAEHVYMGLGGLIIVEDENSKALDLPKRYGEDDIPLVLQDRIFSSSGQLDYSPSRREMMQGYIGDVAITNGAIEPYVDVENKEIRFRILNGSNASVYNLGFENGKTFKQIATDNSFLEAPVSLSRVTLSPAERAEIVVDLSGDYGSSLVLKDFNTGKKFLDIKISKSATTQTNTPNSLVSLTHLNPSDSVNTRRFVLGHDGMNLQINGKSMDMNRIDENVPLNRVEIWEVENSMGMKHNFHIHATHFEIIERNGGSVANNEKGYKDTVYLAPNDKVKLIVKMTDYADAVKPYMYHCHFLEHEDGGMMGQFVVSSNT